MPDYKQGKIYTIRCKTDDTLIHIGCTTQSLCERMSQLRYDSMKRSNNFFYQHPQCPFIPMTDTDVTFLSGYNIVGRARMHVMTLTSPPSLPLSRPWAGLSMRRPTQSHLPIQGSQLLSSLPSSPSVF